MKKLRLELDALKVESFATGAGRPRPGTVRAHVEQEAAAGDDDLVGIASVVIGCVLLSEAFSCRASCGGTCATDCGSCLRNTCEAGCSDACTITCNCA